MLVRLKFAPNLDKAMQMVLDGRRGHSNMHTIDVRIGTETITDPAFLVTRNREDYIQWVDSSRYREHIARYNDKLDDFDLL